VPVRPPAERRPELADGDAINAIEDAECPPPANVFASDRFDAELGSEYGERDFMN
jgi:hypothetical protein